MKCTPDIELPFFIEAQGSCDVMTCSTDTDLLLFNIGLGYQ